MWIAGKRQRIKRNGEYVEVQPGDPVPEAEYWPNRKMFERQGFIRWIKRGESPTPAKSTITVKKAPALRRGLAKTKAPESPPPPKPKPKAKPNKKTKAKPKALKGPGTCPHCGGDYKQLERHKCKQAPK